MLRRRAAAFDKKAWWTGTTSLASFLFQHRLFCRNNGRIGRGKESHYFTNVLSASATRRTGSRDGGRSEGSEGSGGSGATGRGLPGGNSTWHVQRAPGALQRLAYYTITGSDDKCMLPTTPREQDYERALAGSGPPILNGRIYGQGLHVDATPVLAYRGFARVLAAALPPALRPRVRFLVLLREPVSRDISMYNHMSGIGSRWGFCHEVLAREAPGGGQGVGGRERGRGRAAAPSPDAAPAPAPTNLPTNLSYHAILAAHLR